MPSASDPIARVAAGIAFLCVFAAPSPAAGAVSSRGPARPSCGIWELMTYSSAPVQIAVVGSSRGLPDATIGQFTVVARSGLDIPLPGASVVVDLSACPDLTLCSDQLDPDASLNFEGKMIRKFSGSDGRATFTILGSSNGAGNALTLLSGGRIYINGVQLSTPTVAAYDLDGSGGIGANDLSAWLTDFGSGVPFGRSDYDGSDGVGANDLSLWLTAFGDGRSTSTCAR